MKRAWTDQQVEQKIAALLGFGVGLAASVLLLGEVWALFKHAAAPMQLHVFHGTPSEVRGVRGLVAAILAGHSQALIMLGVLLLILTPVARVAFAAVAFAMQRDRVYLGITLLVLLILLYGLLR